MTDAYQLLNIPDVPLCLKLLKPPCSLREEVVTHMIRRLAGKATVNDCSNPSANGNSLKMSQYTAQLRKYQKITVFYCKNVNGS